MLTFCADGMKMILCDIKSKGILETPEIRLTEIGMITDKYIKQIPDHYQNVVIDIYVIMPNHVHILLTINRSSPIGEKRIGVDTIIRSTKTLITKEIGYSVWQKGFHDVVVNSEQLYNNCYEYIRQNPTAWIWKSKEPFAPK